MNWDKISKQIHNYADGNFTSFIKMDSRLGWQIYPFWKSSDRLWGPPNLLHSG
jgi:hypothetical protein